MLILWGTKESHLVFSERDIQDWNYGRVPGGTTVFNGNLKVAAIGDGFGKINTYKKVAKSVLLMEVFTEIGGEGK